MYAEIACRWFVAVLLSIALSNSLKSEVTPLQLLGGAPILIDVDSSDFNLSLSFGERIIGQVYEGQEIRHLFVEYSTVNGTEGTCVCLP